MNAIYFKGMWAKPLDKSNTIKGDFYNSKTEKVEVDFMHQENSFDVGYFGDEDFYAQILEMKYANSNLSFVIVMPDGGLSLPEVEAKLKDYDWAKLTRNLDRYMCDVFIPKFKIEYEIKLNERLKSVSGTRLFRSLSVFYISILFYSINLRWV